MTSTIPTPVADTAPVRTAARRIRLVAASLAVLLAGAGLAAVPAGAAFAAGTITVTTNVDADTNGACTNPNVTTVATPVTLRNALCVAGNQAGSTTVSVPRDTYTLSASFGELAFGAVSGAKITVVGAGAALPGGPGTAIVGDGQHRVMNIDPQTIGGVDVTLRGLTVRGGVDDRAQPGMGGSGGFGGAGIIAGSGYSSTADSLTLDSVFVMNNAVRASTSGGWNSGGGGIQFVGGSLTLTDSKILNNSSAAGSGGGVYYEAAPGLAGQKLTITNGDIANNQVTDATTFPADGGGLSVSGSAPSSTIAGTNFVGNAISATGTGAVRGSALAYAGGTHTLTGILSLSNAVSAGGQISADAGARVTARWNDIETVDTSGFLVSATNGASVDAAYNWWGCATAPGSTGCGSAVTAGVTVLPSLRLNLDAAPATVGAPGDTSRLTATFRRDSTGAAVDSASLTRFSSTVSFSRTAGGQLSASSVPMSLGEASTTFTTPSTAGRSTITAAYNAVQVTVDVIAAQAPAFTSASTVGFTFGTAGSFTITTSGYPAAEITRTAGTLPAGLTFIDNGDGTATLAGTPTAASTSTLSLKADNGASSSATQQLVVTVRQAPAITSGATATFTAGTAESFTVTTSGSPAPSLARSGALPSGVTFTDNGDGTATIAGTPAASAGGSYPLTITASNDVNPSATQPFTLTVNAAPRFTSSDSAAARVGTAASIAVTTTGGYPTPTTLTESGALPAGVTFVDQGSGSATISGTPAAVAGGVYTLVITAKAGSLTTTQTLTLTVGEAPVVTTNPVSRSTTGGSSVAFTAAGSGYPEPSIQWQKRDGGSWSDLDGETDATLSFTATAEDDGTAYRAVFTNTHGSATTTAAELAVGAGPAITSDATATISGDGGSQTVEIRASGEPVPAISVVSGGVPGMNFADAGDGTATLTGAPTSSGVFTVDLAATNEHGTGEQTLTVTVNQSTEIGSPSTADFTAGIAGSFTITTAGGYPTPPTIELDGDLPDGLGFVDDGDGTARIFGTASAGTGGASTVDVVATTAAGHVTRQTITVVVGEAPVITGPARVTATTGVPFSATVTTAHAYPLPVTLAVVGALPAGVTFVDEGDGTGTLSGAATAAQDATITIEASNTAGSITADVMLTVDDAAVIPLPLILPTTFDGPLDGVPAELRRSQSFTVAGSGFAPGAPVTLGIYSTPTTLATVYADGAGAFSQALTVPADFAAGGHTVVATGVGADGTTRTLGSATTVVVPADAGGGSGGSGGSGSGGSGSVASGSGAESSLAATGVGEGWMLAAALALLALLAGIRLVLRRRAA
ncbi:putative Ig domain-containing protein [Schumannella sp. 10F1B-5-1]|uniref:beta strand repeat-containing protein n=1 Tax=Schumannella sp. 10F1B-5-1 TaxID=2590780 RepID=UPI0011321D87|nr:putative Ig domain-containing protein [Schumannella sp. 10F1B-5-1]TPW76867.1 hypothetical protein FJ658_02745 [Schumannella sp. 10F1B-5-1]